MSSTSISKHVSPASLQSYGSVGDGKSSRSDVSDDSGDENIESTGCFPFEPFLLLRPVLFWMPQHLRRFQSWTHLIIGIGMLFMGPYMILTTYYWLFQSGGKGRCLAFDNMEYECYCGFRLLSIMFLLYCFVYFIRLSSEFDEDLLQKRKKLKKVQKECTKSFESLVSDMDTTLVKYADTNAALAERNFENKRRDFVRFLKRIKTVTESEPQRLAGAQPAFLRFVKLWLHTVEECSIDPVNHPLLVVMESELRNDASILELTVLLLERLDKLDLQICTNTVKQNMAEVQKTKQRFYDLSYLQKLNFRRRQQTLRDDDGGGPSDAESGQLASDPSSGPSSQSLRAHRAGNCCCISLWSCCSWSQFKASRQGKHHWVHFHRPYSPKGRRWGTEGKEMPVTLMMGPLHIVLLSARHIILLFTAVLSILFFIWEVCHMIIEWRLEDEEILKICFTQCSAGGVFSAFWACDRPQGVWCIVHEVFSRQTAVALLAHCTVVVLIIVCLGFVLYNFVRIDDVQVLAGQLKELTAEQASLDARREKLVKYHEAAERQADVWLHRTLPRLDIMKELHDTIEDSPKPSVELKQACDTYTMLERSLPPLALWCSDSSDAQTASFTRCYGAQVTLTSEQRQFLGNSMNQLLRGEASGVTIMRELPSTAGKIEEWKQNNLKALPAPIHEDSWFSSW